MASVFVILVLLLLALPIAELYVIVRFASVFGVLDTLAVLILVSVVGAWLVKRQGLAVLRRIQQQVQAGRMPTKELVDGVLVLLAGALLVTPGFLTDVAGVLLLLPPVRAAVRPLVLRRYRRRVDTVRQGAVHLGRIRHTVVEVDGRPGAPWPRDPSAGGAPGQRPELGGPELGGPDRGV